MQVAIVGAVGPMFGLSRIQSLRAGLLLASGGEFAFVALCAPSHITTLLFGCLPPAATCPGAKNLVF